MKTLFRFWIRTSALWILFTLILGGKLWHFPASFQECWDRQRWIFHRDWAENQPVSAVAKFSKSGYGEGRVREK